MANVSLEFHPFNDPRMSATAAAWLQDANDGLAFPSEVKRLLDWSAAHQEHVDGDAAAYGVFPKGKTTALGICEVIITQKSVRAKWVKMLRLHLKPSVDASLQSGSPDEAMDVFTEAIRGSLDLQMAHKAATLKVYGRTNEQLSFLKALVGHINGRTSLNQDSALKVTIDGRFLSIVVH